MNKAKPEDVNKYSVGFRISKILTDYAQKLPGHWFSLTFERGIPTRMFDAKVEDICTFDMYSLRKVLGYWFWTRCWF